MLNKDLKRMKESTQEPLWESIAAFLDGSPSHPIPNPHYGFYGPIQLFSFYFTLFLTPLFLFSDVFFPLKERLTGVWLYVAEALPLLHPVRLMRAAFRGEASPVLLWDVLYSLALSAVLLAIDARVIRKRLANPT